MAVGKNKRLSKRKGKPGKKIVDPYTRKDWFEVKAPNIFTVRNFCQTLVNRTQGNTLASDSLKGRVFEISLGDLNKNEEVSYRKMRLRIDEIQGKTCLTNFHGMDFTTDKIRSLVRKWQSLIENIIDVKTADGYLIRLFCIAFTKKRQSQIKKTAYAQSSQIRQIRKKMTEIMTREANTDLKELFHKFTLETIGKEIEKACQSIYPLQNVFIRKAKILKSPKYDVSKLLEVHGESTAADDTGAKVERTKFKEPTPSDSV